MAPKNLVVVLAALLLTVVAAAGRVPGGAALGASTTSNSSVLIAGVVPCAAGNSINAATAPAFPNAGLQLVCGSKEVVASATADGNGAFLFSLAGVAPDLLASLIGGQCKVVVVTPLVACDKSLQGAATGTLTARLKLLGIDTAGSSGVDLGGIIGLVGKIIGGLIGGIVNLGTQSFSLT